MCAYLQEGSYIFNQYYNNYFNTKHTCRSYLYDCVKYPQDFFIFITHIQWFVIVLFFNDFLCQMLIFEQQLFRPFTGDCYKIECRTIVRLDSDCSNPIYIMLYCILNIKSINILLSLHILVLIPQALLLLCYSIYLCIVSIVHEQI